MSQQQTFTIKQGIRYAAKVINNDYLFLMNIDNLQSAHGKEWYEASEGLSCDKFLMHLAGLVNYGNFTDSGVAKVIKRLQERGFLIMEPLRVQVTQKWRDIVDEYGGYLNNGDKTTEQIRAEEEEKLLRSIDNMLKDIEAPKTQNIREFRRLVNKLVYEGNKAFKKKLKDATFKGRIDELDKLLKSDYLLRQFFENALRNNSRAAASPPNAPPTRSEKSGSGIYSLDNVQKEIDNRMSWRIHLNMSEKQFHQELKDTYFWMNQKARQKQQLTEAEATRLSFIIKYLDNDTVDNSAKRKAFYDLRISELKAQQVEQATGPLDPSVAAALANIVKTV